MKPIVRLVASLLGTVIAATPLALAQGPGSIATTRFQSGPSVLSWHFDRALAHDSLGVERVSQISIPLAFGYTFGRVSIDAGLAWASGRVGLSDGDDLTLSGITDVKLRGVVRISGDRLLATAGINAPTGRTKLTGSEVDALRILGSPALGLPVRNLGTGFGATAGLVYAGRMGSWGVAVGASVEARGQYAPIEALIAGVSTPTDLDPGNVYRISLGTDHLFEAGRLSLLVAGDVFGDDAVTLHPANGSPIRSQYRLGPRLSVDALLELGVRGFQQFSVAASDRLRSRFSGSDGRAVPGSNGNGLELSAEGITGRPGRPGLYVRLEARLESGLEVDNTITTAAMTAGGVSLGVAIPWRRAQVQAFGKLLAGSIDQGPISSSALGIGGGIVITVRR